MFALSGIAVCRTSMAQWSSKYIETQPTKNKTHLRPRVVTHDKVVKMTCISQVDSNVYQHNLLSSAVNYDLLSSAYQTCAFSKPCVHNFGRAHQWLPIQEQGLLPKLRCLKAKINDIPGTIERSLKDTFETDFSLKYIKVSGDRESSDEELEVEG